MRAREQRDVRRAGGEEIGVGKEPALGFVARRAQPAPSAPRPAASSTVLPTSGLAAQRTLELGERRAFDDRRTTLCVTSPCVSLASRLRQRDARRDFVVAGLDRAIDAAHARKRDQRPVAMRQHAGRGEVARDGAQRRARLHVERVRRAAAAAAAVPSHHAHAADRRRGDDDATASEASEDATSGTMDEARREQRVAAPGTADATARIIIGRCSFARTPFAARVAAPHARLHADRDPGRHRDPRHPRRARRAARARAARRGARRRRQERHRGDHAGAQALSTRQPALSDDRAGPGRAGREARRSRRCRPTGSRTAISNDCRRIRGATPTNISIRDCAARSTSSASAPTASPGGTGIDADIGSWDLYARRRRAACAARQRGFTLVEMLVVIVIIAIAAGIVVVDRATATTASASSAKRARLAGALEHAAALAQWRAETLGFSADGAAYRFWRRATRHDRWSRVADDDVLARARAAGAMALSSMSYAGRHRSPPTSIVPLRATRPQRALRVRAHRPRMALRARRRSVEPRAADQSRAMPPAASRWSRSWSRWRSSPSRWPRGCARSPSRPTARRALKARTLALWVAQNRLAAAQLATPWPGLGRTTAKPTQAGARFVWRESVSGTPNPSFRRIDIIVAEPRNAGLRARAAHRLSRQSGAAPMSRRRAPGFTLIELLIALAILGSSRSSATARSRRSRTAKRSSPRKRSAGGARRALRATRSRHPRSGAARRRAPGTRMRARVARRPSTAPATPQLALLARRLRVLAEPGRAASASAIGCATARSKCVLAARSTMPTTVATQPCIRWQSDIAAFRVGYLDSRRRVARPLAGARRTGACRARYAWRIDARRRRARSSAGSCCAESARARRGARARDAARRARGDGRGRRCAADQQRWIRDVEHRRDQVQAQALALAGVQWARQILDDDAAHSAHSTTCASRGRSAAADAARQRLDRRRIDDAQGRLNLNNARADGTPATASACDSRTLFAARRRRRRSTRSPTGSTRIP